MRVSSPTRLPDWVDWLIHYTPFDIQNRTKHAKPRMKKYKFRRDLGHLYNAPVASIFSPLADPPLIQGLGNASNNK